MEIDEFLDRELADLGLSEQADRGKGAKKTGSEESSIFDSIKADLGKGSLEDAEQSYIRLWNLLMQQKLKWNRDLYEQIYSLSTQLSATIAQAYEELKRKANHIYGLISRARNALKEGKKDMPMKLYAEMQEMSSSIPSVFFEEKRIVQEQIISFYRDLVNTTDSELSKRIAAIIDQINQLLNITESSIRNGSVNDAASNYSRCIELFNQIPEGFIKTKTSLGMRLLDIYKTISIHAEISGLQKQLGYGVPVNRQRIQPKAYTGTYQRQAAAKIQVSSLQPNQEYRAKQEKSEKMPSQKEAMLHRKREHAKRNIKKGFYNEAWKDVEEALQIDPNDAEAITLRAKVKTLQ